MTLALQIVVGLFALIGLIATVAFSTVVLSLYREPLRKSEDACAQTSPLDGCS